MLLLLERGMDLTSGQVLVAFLLLLAALQAVLEKWQGVSVVFVLIFCSKEGGEGKGEGKNRL